MAKPQDYSELVLQAEKAVATVRDPELKKVAFEKVLDDLLASPTARKPEKAVAVGKATSKAKTARAATNSGPKGYVETLISDGFFRKPKTISEVKGALENLGHHIPVTSLSGPLQKLCQQRLLRRQKLANSGAYAYSEW
jgi:hypothetical protein